MKKRIKAAIAMMLSVIITLSLFSTATAALISEELPIVYVLGKVDVIYQNKDGRSDDRRNKVIYPVSIDDVLETAPEKLGDILTAYAEAFATEYVDATATEKKKLDAWEKYGLALYDLLGDVFDDIAFDLETGEPKDNSGIIWDWDKNYRDGTGINILEDKQDGYGKYGLYDYTFHYDWRRDMYENAEYLNAYINDVLEATGKEKCILISRCYGCNLVGAYFERYGSEKIETNILYCSTAEGTLVCGEMFCGRFNLNPEGMANYMDDLLFGEDSGLLSSIIISNATNPQFDASSFDTMAGIVNKIYSRISHVVMPKTLINSFASMPGYWSLVGDTYYTEAREYVFGDQAYTTYRRLVDKIDYYHYTVTNNAADIFRSSHEDYGTNYANIVKYGTQIAPMVESSDYLGDGIVEVPSASFGATSGKVGETFSAQYMLEARKNGNIRYIDPAATIDASTCMYPDYTWFAEGIDHFDFPESVDKLLMAIAQFDGQMTIYDNAAFPQYMRYKGEGNLLTWAGGLYVNNSRDETAGTIRNVFSTYNFIIAIIARAIQSLSFIFGKK